MWVAAAGNIIIFCSSNDDEEHRKDSTIQVPQSCCQSLEAYNICQRCHGLIAANPSNSVFACLRILSKETQLGLLKYGSGASRSNRRTYEMRAALSLTLSRLLDAFPPEVARWSAVALASDVFGSGRAKKGQASVINISTSIERRSGAVK